MAYAPIYDADAGLIKGQFRNSYGLWFEYSATKEGESTLFPGYPVKIYTGGGIDQGFRWAKVLKTVAYLIVDENADGSPVVEKWQIKGHKVYGGNA